MQLETSHEQISHQVLAPSRSMGPLLALISVQTDNPCLKATTTTLNTENDGKKSNDPIIYQQYHQHSLKEMTSEIVRHIHSNPTRFSTQLDNAFQLWRDCINTTWKDRLSSSDYEGLQTRILENRLRFRLSCLRVEAPNVVPSADSRKRKKKMIQQSKSSLASSELQFA